MSVSQASDPQHESNETHALFTVVAGEGDGFLLGLAAGDSAGGAWELGYSAPTEMATLVAYEMITHREVDPERLMEAILEMDGSASEMKVLREESPELRHWIDRAKAGMVSPGPEPSLDAAVLSAVLGVGYRRDPATLIAECVRIGEMFHTDEETLAAGVVSGAAVAASCYAQSGLDLIAGVSEAIRDAGIPGMQVLPDRIRGLMSHVGVTAGSEALEIVAGGDNHHHPLDLVLAGLLIAAPVAERQHGPIEQAARIGGSPLGAVVGAIMGARVGIRAWPWVFANDTWFAEVGRRLVRGPDEVRDLPIPYAVEQHLMVGRGPAFHW